MGPNGSATYRQDTLPRQFSTLQLNNSTATWEETDSITMTSGVEAAVEVNTVTMIGSCSAPCSATKSTPWPPGTMTAGMTLTGTTEYADSPAPGPDSTSLSYSLTMDSPSAPQPATWTWPGPGFPIRCDNLVGSSPGCVIPAAEPTFHVSLTNAGPSAAMIAWAQKNLPDHWGTAANPLRRLADAGLQRTNRTAICDSTFTVDPNVPLDSCDEFPFAATYQSGNLLGVSGKNCAEVEPYIDQVTGQWAIRNVNNVTLTERCVRGHVPLPSNTDVGGDLGRFVQDQRLLDHDPYLLDVTA